jgi:NADH dehydrogenase
MVIAGGGYTGVEFAGELAKSLHILAWKNQYPPEKLEILVVEGTNQIIPGLDDRLSKNGLQRLLDLGVRVQLQSFITSVDKNFISFANGERLSYDILVWSAGVKARPINLAPEVVKDKKGRLIVNSNLQLEKFPYAFAIGDCASFVDSSGRAAPPTAQDAVHQADFLSKALPKIMVNKKPSPYKGYKHGFIVVIGGKWAVVKWGRFYGKGWWVYVLRQLVNLHYYSTLVGMMKAIRYVWFQVKIYSRND